MPQPFIPAPNNGTAACDAYIDQIVTCQDCGAEYSGTHANVEAWIEAHCEDECPERAVAYQDDDQRLGGHDV